MGHTKKQTEINTYKDWVKQFMKALDREKEEHPNYVIYARAKTFVCFIFSRKTGTTFLP